MEAEDSTPEWFKMAQADGFEPKPKSKRVLRIMALATPLFVLGAGLVFAQTQDSPTAVASGVSSTASVSTSATPSADPISLSTPAPTSSAPSTAVQVSQASSVTPSARASITIKKPAITMPTGGGEDDGLRSSDDD